MARFLRPRDEAEMNALYMIRHSLTEGNERRLYYGATDLPLSENGRALCRSLQGSIQLPEGVQFGTSGMLRAEETLRLLIGDVPHEILPDLREMEMGTFEMHSYDELKDNPDYQAWLSDESGAFVIPGGESNQAVRERAVNCVRRLAISEQNAMLAVCHGGIIAAVMHKFFRDPSRSFYDWIPRACHGYAIFFQKGQPSEWKEI